MESLIKKPDRRKPIIITVIFLLPFVVLLISHFVIRTNVSTRMFADISEFSKLDSYIVQENIDEPLIELFSVKESWAKKVNYNGKEFEVRAYVFENFDECIGYYRTQYIQPSADDEVSPWGYRFTMGADYCEFMLRSREKLYIVHGEEKKTVTEFVNWLNESFPEELK